MSVDPDGLEMLLLDVRKNINENSSFLKSLRDDCEDVDEEDSEEDVVVDEEYEEL